MEKVEENVRCDKCCETQEVVHDYKADASYFRKEWEETCRVYNEEVKRCKALRDTMAETVSELKDSIRQYEWLRMRCDEYRSAFSDIRTVLDDENLKAQGIRKRIFDIINQF